MMKFKRRAVKGITLGLVCMVFAAFGICAYGDTEAKTISNLGTYTYNINDTNTTATFRAGQTIMIGTGKYFGSYKEAYYTAYGYNVGAGYYAIYDGILSKTGTSGTIQTTTYPYKSEIKRVTHRAAMWSTSSKTNSAVFDEAYILTGTN